MPDDLKLSFVLDSNSLPAETKRARLDKALIHWQMRVNKYLDLGEKESDPIGKKFYESYALGVANCIAEVKDILAGREPNAV